MVWFLTPAGRIQARDEYGIGSSLYSKDAILKYYAQKYKMILNTTLKNPKRELIL